MKKYKNIDSINEVKSVLGKFQNGYTKKEIVNIDLFANEMFSTKDGLVVLGSGMDQWAFNLEDTKEIIKKHWSKKDNYFKEMNFKFEEAKIFANEDVAWVITLGNISNRISESDQIEKAITIVKKVLNKEEKSQENVFIAARTIADTLREIDKGEDYVWPFRFTGVLIKEDNTWRFHQMQFSLDSVSFWEYRNTDENYDKKYIEMPISNSSEEIEEVREVLRVFQNGYTKRDGAYVDDYMKEVFILEEEQVVIGTDAEELCIGIEAIRRIIASDWKFWGDFVMNVDGASITVNGDAAYFSTKAMIKRIIPKSEILEWFTDSSNRFFNEEGKNQKYKLMDALCSILELLKESERGEIYIAPMRFSEVLVKDEGKWLIHHAQYSDYIDKMPGARILK